MQKFKYLIIGGGVAGTTAAETIRANDKDGSVAMITDEPHPLYSRIMLSKPSFLLKEGATPNIWLKTPDWYASNHIDYLSGKAVSALDTAAKTVTTGDGETFGYEKLLLAIGVHARKWNISGADKKGIHYLRTLDEAKGLASDMKTAKHAVVIGSSCVAFEAIENMRTEGIKVTEVMLEKYFWEPMLDEEGGRIVEKALAAAGVKIMPQSETREVVGGERVEGIVTTKGERVDCDMILCGIGVVHPLEFVKTAGVNVGHGIAVNEYLETNAPDVWSAGDIAEFNDIVINESCMAGNWMSAREQGRIAGLNMSGKKEPFRIVSFYTSHGFGLNVAFAGNIRLAPEKTTVGRGSAESGHHARLILHEGRIVGVASVNMVYEVGTIVKLIEKNVDVSGKEKELADPEFDLKAFL